MIRLIVKILGPCCLLLFTSIKCLAQLPADSVSRDQLIENTIVAFNSAIGEQARLYNGPEYDIYEPFIKGNAYFNDNKEFVTGNVEYDGFKFKDASMLYDMHKDVLVVLSANKVSKIALIKERLSNFDMAGHHFVNINADTLAKSSNIASGIYDELYGGKSRVLVKRRKNLQEAGNLSGAIETYFNSLKETFLLHNGVYTSVGSKGSVLDVFKDKKEELRRYIKSDNIDFKKNQELAITMVATYYDRLTK